MSNGSNSVGLLCVQKLHKALLRSITIQNKVRNQVKTLKWLLLGVFGVLVLGGLIAATSPQSVLRPDFQTISLPSPDYTPHYRWTRYLLPCLFGAAILFSIFRSFSPYLKRLTAFCIFLLIILVGLPYLGGWSIEHRFHKPVSSSEVRFNAPRELSLSDGYIGIELNSGEWWGITPSNRFFKHSWASWVCLFIGFFTFAGGRVFFFVPVDS